MLTKNDHADCNASAALASFELSAGDIGPADLVAEIARALSADGSDYVVYERGNRWILASGAQCGVELDSDELRLTRD